MNYTIATKTRTDNATIEFYFSFDERDGFIKYLSEKERVKKDFGALSVAVALEKNVLRVIMPFGTNQSEFTEKAKKVLQFHYNMFSLKRRSFYDENVSDMFGTLFGGPFGRKS